MNTIPNPTTILQKLIQFDTTNPPGNEYLAINWVEEILNDADITSKKYALDSKRPNLITRIRGRGDAPPILLQGHVDVVTTKGQDWEHPPFSGDIIDGYIWGRGALDMKGAVSMMLSAFLEARQKELTLPGDVILCLLADEEANGDYGAKFLVEQHPEIFTDVKYAIGEAGGFSMDIAGKTFYPIMIAEKQICWINIMIHGPGGHGSMIHRNGTMSKLSKILGTLNEKTLPVHITPGVRMMFESIAKELSFPLNILLTQLLNPSLTKPLLRLLGEKGNLFEPLFHNTVNPTIVDGGEKINVIPSEICLQLDGRLLPGFGPTEMLDELKNLLGRDYEYEIVRHDQGPAKPDMGFFPILGDILKQLDPSGCPVPFVMMAVTDARYFSKLGIQTYGFTPMQLPTEFKFNNIVHGANERIPIDALDFGTQAILEAMKRNTLGK